MILVIDIGNTNIVLGIYKEDNLIANWRIETDQTKTGDELGVLVLSLLAHKNIKSSDITGIAISSVVPNIMFAIEKMCRTYFNINPFIVGPGTKIGINIKMDNPKEVGADLIVGAVAAHDIYKSPVIIVDFGTATKFIAISNSGDFLGGCISAGLKASTEAMSSKTAKLPAIDIKSPKKVIGKNTVDAMRAGVIYGFVGKTDYLVNRIKEEMQEDNIKVVATGGYAFAIADESDVIDEVDEWLLLKGLLILYKKNMK